MVRTSASSRSSSTTRACGRSSSRSSAADQPAPALNFTLSNGPHNEALLALIRARIEAEGPLPFSEFYRLALYHPQYGYYLNCDPTLDYQSSPNVHPLFGACVAIQIAGFWQEMGSPPAFTVFEAAAGSGRLCADILAALRGMEPKLYDIIRYVQQDPSLDGDGGRKRLLASGVPEDKIEIAASLPVTADIEGCIISNELLDALPFERVRRRGGRLYELRVGLDGSSLADVETEPSEAIRAYFEALGQDGPGEGCDAEVCLEAAPWLTTAAASLKRGYVLTLDYGYEAPELFASWRRRGTLLTFYRHTSDDKPYAHVGLQDITASVDFTTVRRAGEAAGLTTVAQASQAEYLAALGIGDTLSQPPAADAIEAYYALRRAAIELTDMAGLGRIQVLLQAKL